MQKSILEQKGFKNKEDLNTKRTIDPITKLKQEKLMRKEKLKNLCKRKDEIFNETTSSLFSKFDHLPIKDLLKD